MLLAYSNVKLLTSAGTVLPYFPYLRVVVSADAVLFNPAVGQRLGASWSGGGGALGPAGVVRRCASGGRLLFALGRHQGRVREGQGLRLGARADPASPAPPARQWAP